MVGYLWMHAKHLKDCNPGRPSLDMVWIDLEPYNFFNVICYAKLSQLYKYILPMVQSQP